MGFTTSDKRKIATALGLLAGVSVLKNLNITINIGDSSISTKSEPEEVETLSEFRCTKCEKVIDQRPAPFYRKPCKRCGQYCSGIRHKDANIAPGGIMLPRIAMAAGRDSTNSKGGYCNGKKLRGAAALNPDNKQFDDFCKCDAH